MSDPLELFLTAHDQFIIQQQKELTEILIDWETKNQYKVFDDQKNQLGLIAEKAGGFSDAFVRAILRSHRPLEVAVLNKTGDKIMQFARTFFFFFSSMDVLNTSGTLLGTVKRRFGILFKKYDLVDPAGHTFASIKSPLWRLWTFPVAGRSQLNTATISKKWSGPLREVFTDADTFLVDYERGQWDLSQRAVIFAAAISIDFDFFENNQGSGGALNMLTPFGD